MTWLHKSPYLDPDCHPRKQGAFVILAEFLAYFAQFSHNEGKRGITIEVALDMSRQRGMKTQLKRALEPRYPDTARYIIFFRLADHTSILIRKTSKEHEYTSEIAHSHVVCSLNFVHRHCAPPFIAVSARTMLSVLTASARI
jgi:hypothetical protein